MRILSCTLAAALFLGLGSALFACPNCKDALAVQNGQGGVNLNASPWGGFGSQGAAYSFGVLFMLGMLSMVATGFFTAVYRLHRKQQALHAASPPPPPDQSQP